MIPSMQSCSDWTKPDVQNQKRSVLSGFESFSAILLFKAKLCPSALRAVSVELSTLAGVGQLTIC